MEMIVLRLSLMEKNDANNQDSCNKYQMFFSVN